MKLIRYELIFDGEPQNVGFLQGLDGVLSKRAEQRYQDQFVQLLPIPQIPEDKAINISFWFTPKGISVCQKALSALAAALKKRGWELGEKSIDIPDMQLSHATTYIDEFQCALPVDVVDPMVLPIRDFHANV